MTQDGENVTLDMTLVKGGQADGTMTVQGGLATLRRIGREAYMQGDGDHGSGCARACARA